MAETWLKSCTKVPYPDPLSRLDQYGSGVPNGGNPYGNSMQFIVNHVVAGMFSPSNQPIDVMRARGNSWPITLFRDGHAEQHFPLEAMCWHAGAKANYRSDGIEWEGGTNHSGRSNNKIAPIFINTINCFYQTFFLNNIFKKLKLTNV